MNNHVRSEYEHFRAWRLRVNPAYDADIKAIARSYNEWTKYAKCIRGIKTKKLTMNQLCQHLVEDFGHPVDDRRFRGVMVFYDAEGVNEWDRKHQIEFP